MLLAEFGSGQVFWSMLWFFLFVIWIWILISVFSDILRSPDLSGWSKALWVIFVIVLPYLGVFVYLVARGKKMSEHAVAEAEARDAQFRHYVQSVADPAERTTAEEISNLTALRGRGVLNEAEFQQAKAKALGT